MPQALSLIHQMTLETPTEFWNDACDVKSLTRAVAQGATGATSNPVIVLAAIEADKDVYLKLTRDLIAREPYATEVDIAWKLVEHAAKEGAKVLQPIFERFLGLRGRLSVQVDPTLYPDAKRMVEHGEHLATLAPNMAIKVPAVAAGIAAIEELTARGIPTNATVCFTIPQALAVAEAVERGLKKRRASGQDTTNFQPWCTIMVGRLDDHLRDCAREQKIPIDIDIVRWASTATFRKAYKLFKNRNYHTKLLAAAMRSFHHWSEFIGGDVVITIPPNWQDDFNRQNISVKARIDEPVPEDILTELLRKLPDFKRAYNEDGLSPNEFVTFGATVKTLHQFLGGYQDLLKFVRSVMLPK